MATPIKTTSQLDDATRDALDQLSAHGVTAATMLDRHRNALAATYRDKRWSAEGRAAQLAQLRDSFRQEVARHHGDTQAALETLAQAHQRARLPTADSSAQLLAFQREQDGVARARKMADAGVPLLDIIKQAGAAGDTALLAGLRRHLPADLAAQETHAPGIVKAHLDAVAQAEEPHLSDVERAVRQQEGRLQALQAAATYNQRMLDTAAKHPLAQPPAATFIGGEDGRQAIPVGPEPEGLPRM